MCLRRRVALLQQRERHLLVQRPLHGLCAAIRNLARLMHRSDLELYQLPPSVYWYVKYSSSGEMWIQNY